jgi:hypothetical protein
MEHFSQTFSKKKKLTGHALLFNISINARQTLADSKDALN